MLENLKVTYSNIVRIALPLMIGGLSFTLVNLTDTAFLSQLGPAALGGSGNAVLLFALFVEVGMGFSIGSQIIIARRNGEQKHKSIGSLFQHTLLFLIVYALLVFLFLRFAMPHISSIFIKSEDVRTVLHSYLNVRSWGVIFFCINMAFSAFFVGSTKTKIIGIVTPITALVNIVLDYTLIFGNWGFPQLGVEGAALASNLAEFLATVFYLFALIFVYDHKKFHLFDWKKFDLTVLNQLFKIGSPVMIQEFIALGAWFTFFSVIEHLGENELAVSHMVRSIYMVLIIPVFGLGNTVNSLTGNLLGSKQPQLINDLLKKSLILGLVYCAVLQPLFYISPKLLFLPFTTDPLLLEMGIPTTRVVFGALFLFTAMIVGFRVISGAGKTWIGLGIESATIVIYLVSAWYLASLPQVDLWVVWTSEFIYFGVFLVLVYIYLWKGKWRESKL